MVQDFFLVIILDGAWLSRDLRPASDDDMLAGRALTASRLQSGSIIGPRSLVGLLATWYGTRCTEILV